MLHVVELAEKRLFNVARTVSAATQGRGLDFFVDFDLRSLPVVPSELAEGLLLLQFE